MKKFWKILLIVILVLGTIAGTCWIFYSQFKKKRESYTLALNYLESSDRLEFNALLNDASNASGMSRFGYMLTTLNKLDEINETLTPYLAQANSNDVDQNKIYSHYNTFVDMQPGLRDMFNEYITKAQSVTAFNRDTGANPVYKELSSYMINYSEYLLVISDELQNIFNRSQDTKFYMIEIYLNVVIYTFSNTEEVAGSLQIKYPTNLLRVNENLKFNNYSISNFSTNATLFRETYIKCDSKKFASNFASNLTSSIALNGNVENDAMFYLKKVLEGV